MQRILFTVMLCCNRMLLGSSSRFKPGPACRRDLRHLTTYAIIANLNFAPAMIAGLPAKLSNATSHAITGDGITALGLVIFYELPGDNNNFIAMNYSFITRYSGESSRISS